MSHQTPVVRQVRAMMQFGQTLRYHAELLLKPQDVGQHSFNVAWLCWELNGTPDGPRLNLIMAALSHDAGERWTGDMPAPTKRAIPGLREDLDALEALRLREHGADVADWHLTEDERRLLKLADALEGAWFCLRELKMGNRLVIDAVEGGSGLTYMTYVRELLSAAPDPVGQQLYNYLRGEYDEYGYAGR